MIQYVTGDLLGATQKVIVHGVNAQGVMGSGVAKLIRARWPEVYEVYSLQYKTFGLKPGDIIPVNTADGKIIVNAVTQENFGHDGQMYCDYSAIERCFEQINEKSHDWEAVEIAMPKIGAGLGGGNWSTIESIIVKTANRYSPVVYSL